MKEGDNCFGCPVGALSTKGMPWRCGSNGRVLPKQVLEGEGI